MNDTLINEEKEVIEEKCVNVGIDPEERLDNLINEILINQKKKV